MKRDKDQQLVLEQLKKIPIIEIACEKIGISRSTFYRWREDKEFAEAAEAAMKDGELYINDLSEAQVVTLIRDKNWPAISFWLRAHHPKYKAKVDVTARVETPKDLTPEQEEAIKRAMKLATIMEEDDAEGKGKK